MRESTESTTVRPMARGMMWRGHSFTETMPSRYRQLFQGPTVHEHEGIALRRAGAPAYAEIWKRLPQGAAIVCVVADDRPGFLSYLATALTAQSIDILAAQVFARRDPRGSEVVDLFWLKRDESVAPSLVESDLGRVADLVGGLMTGELRTDGRGIAARHEATDDSATLIRFDDSPDLGHATLTLETVERPGLFRAATGALERAGVRIVRTRRAPGPGFRVIHRFAITEADGRAPDQYRRGTLQADVLRVIEPHARGSSVAIPPDDPADLAGEESSPL
jgi:UTP:GlnB (protein PII) uridylyltransferase